MGIIKQAVLSYLQKGFFSIFYCEMSHIDGNILNNSAFVGEKCRIACSTQHFSNFLPEVCELLPRILRQNGKVQLLYSFFKKNFQQISRRLF